MTTTTKAPVTKTTKAPVTTTTKAPVTKTTKAPVTTTTRAPVTTTTTQAPFGLSGKYLRLITTMPSLFSYNSLKRLKGTYMNYYEETHQRCLVFNIDFRLVVYCSFIFHFQPSVPAKSATLDTRKTEIVSFAVHTSETLSRHAENSSCSKLEQDTARVYVDKSNHNKTIKTTFLKLCNFIIALCFITHICNQLLLYKFFL